MSSDLTLLECLVKPLRDDNRDLVQEFIAYFDRALEEIVPLNRRVMQKAAEIRAEYNFKTPDSIHLAAAIESGCGVFLTNDHRLDRFTGIQIEVISK